MSDTLPWLHAASEQEQIKETTQQSTDNDSEADHEVVKNTTEKDYSYLYIYKKDLVTQKEDSGYSADFISCVPSEDVEVIQCQTEKTTDVKKTPKRKYIDYQSANIGRMIGQITKKQKKKKRKLR